MTLIDKAEALASIEKALNNATGDLYDAYAAIAALPARGVRVPESVIHRTVLDWIRDDAGVAVKMSVTPDQANALTARILAALATTDAAHVNKTPKSEHDAGNVLTAAQAREAALREAAAEVQRWFHDGRDNRDPAALILALIGGGSK